MMSNDGKMLGQETSNQFTSRMGYILAIVGFAVGEGNFWRFPFICGMYGGAVFLAIYIGIVLVMGVPLLACESVIGYDSRRTCVDAYPTLTPERTKLWSIAGWIHMGACSLSLVYPAVVIAITIQYIIITMMGGMLQLDTLGIQAYYDGRATDSMMTVVFFTIHFVIVALLIKKDINNGVAKMCKIMIPIMVITVVGMAIFAMLLPGAEKGLAFYLLPRLEAFSFEGLRAALGQVFFSLGIGMGVTMLFASVRPEATDGSEILKDCVIISAADTIFAVLVGLLIFPLAFAFGLNPDAGAGLIFVTLPQAFNLIGGIAGRIIAVLFYTAFLMAVISSEMAMIEGTALFVSDHYKVSRDKAYKVTLAFVYALGIIVIFFYDQIMSVTAFIDYGLIIGAFLMAVYIGWFWGLENIFRVLNIRNQWVKNYFTFSVKYLSPVAIIAVLIFQFI